MDASRQPTSAEPRRKEMPRTIFRRRWAVVVATSSVLAMAGNCGGRPATSPSPAMMDYVPCIDPNWAKGAHHVPTEFLFDARWIYREACAGEACRVLGLLLTGPTTAFDADSIAVDHRGVDAVFAQQGTSRGLRVAGCTADVREGEWRTQFRLDNCDPTHVVATRILGDFDASSGLALVRRGDQEPCYWEAYDIRSKRKAYVLKDPFLCEDDVTVHVLGPSILVSSQEANARRALYGSNPEIWRDRMHDPGLRSTSSSDSDPAPPPAWKHRLIDPATLRVRAQIDLPALQFLPLGGDLFAFFGFNSLQVFNVRTGTQRYALDELVPNLRPAPPAGPGSFYVTRAPTSENVAFIFYDQTSDSQGFSFGNVLKVDMQQLRPVEYHRTTLCK